MKKKISHHQMQDAPVTSRVRSSEAGFTLIETSIAMIIMLVAALAAASLFVFAINYNSGATDRQLAMAVAQQRMEHLRSITFDSTTRNLAFSSNGLGATCTSSTSCTTGVSQTVSSSGRNYTLLSIINDVKNDAGGNPTLKRITLRVTPQAVGMQFGAVTLTTMRTTTEKGVN